MGSGAVGIALKLALEARELAPNDAEVLRTWLHSAGLELLEGDQGGDVARRAVALIDEARRLGAKRADLAFALLVAAVVIKNDRLARRLLDQHEAQALDTDAVYEFAAGAALDLDCDGLAEERFRRSSKGWDGALLPKLRRARSLAFAERRDEALRELASAEPCAPVKIMGDVIQALTEPRAVRARVDPYAIADLPRSLRPLAQALTVSPSNQQTGLDAALSEIDCPLVAVACSDIAEGAADFNSAELALQAALAMRSELTVASERLVLLRIRRGNLDEAALAARAAGDDASLALLDGIGAYEDCRADLLKQTVDNAGEEPGWGWSLAPLALRQLLGKPSKPTSAELVPLVEKGEPWADMLHFDVLLEAGDIEAVKKIIASWSDPSPSQQKRRMRLLDRAKL